MSVSAAPQEISNPSLRPWVITVIVVIVLASPTWAKVVGAYADAGSTLTLLLALSGTAAKYRDHSSLCRTTQAS